MQYSDAVICSWKVHGAPNNRPSTSFLLCTLRLISKARNKHLFISCKVFLLENRCASGQSSAVMEESELLNHEDVNM